MRHGRARKGWVLALFSLIFTLTQPALVFADAPGEDADREQTPPTENSWEPILRTGYVTAISDGDTIRFRDDLSYEDDEDLRVRFVSIDTPEIWHNRLWVGQEPWGQHATKYLAWLIPVGTRVSLVDFGKDRYGRHLGWVIYRNVNINYRMVKDGWATPYIICDGPRCNEEFFQRERVRDYFAACDEARSKELGVFNPENPMLELPFEYRNRINKEAPKRWVADIDTMTLYRPEEYTYVDVCRRVFFRTVK
ncbi:MAG TPA: thermonuclease family protein, partial [Oligoflexia bacterium]|nr:thermonuclease family protein [Oligoflexia bacterium]